MRVAIVSHNFNKGGGQARVNYELARHCLVKGITVTAVAEAVAADLLEAGLIWHKVSIWPHRPYLLSDRAFACAAERVVQGIRDSVDLVVGNGFVLRHARHAVSISHFVHGAWRVSPHHTSRTCGGVYGRYHAFYTWCNARWEKEVYAVADTVVAVSKKVREELCDIGLPDDKVRVIPNGVDLDEFCPGSQDRGTLGLPCGVPLALFVGDIRSPRKNLDGILRALVQVPHIHLAVVGNTAQSPYPAQAAALGVGDRVGFLGYRLDVARIMRAADLFVFPSRYEACSLALLEALASGLPVITARTTGGSELVDKSCGVVLKDAEDAGMLASALSRLASDPVERRVLSIGARQRALNFSWSSMAAQYIDLFKSCCADRPHKRDTTAVACC